MGLVRRAALPLDAPSLRGRGPRVVRKEVIVPGLDPIHDGVRIAHLTDLHVGLLTPHKHIRAAVAAAQAAHPDLVLLTGDFLCYSPRFVERLGELLHGLDMPVYAVLGNHDYWTDADGARRVLEKNGYTVLRNQHTRLDLRGAPLHIVGIDDAVTNHADAAKAFHGLASNAGKSDGGSRIVLTHVPSEADRAASYGPALMLAGHTHGGHVNLGRVTQRLAARWGVHYLAGFYRVDGSLLYVNRGVGSSSVPIRAGAPSEVAVFTLRSPEVAATS